MPLNLTHLTNQYVHILFLLTKIKHIYQTYKKVDKFSQ